MSWGIWHHGRQKLAGPLRTPCVDSNPVIGGSKPVGARNALLHPVLSPHRPYSPHWGLLQAPMEVQNHPGPGPPKNAQVPCAALPTPKPPHLAAKHQLAPSLHQTGFKCEGSQTNRTKPRRRFVPAITCGGGCPAASTSARLLMGFQPRTWTSFMVLYPKTAKEFFFLQYLRPLVLVAPLKAMKPLFATFFLGVM